jgi:tetratricopeptide (TPR) repeat protein
LHRPLDNHDGLLDSDDRTFDEVRDFGLPFEEAAEFCGIGTQPLANSGPAMGFEEHDRISEHAEDVALMDLFALEGKLAKCHRRYEEHSPQALEIRFALAKALKSLGKHDEAENHYRKILDKDSRIDVQAYLGMILAESDRLEESMKWLFIALTGFIVNFGDYSFQGNTSLFVLVYGLFDRLIRQNEQKWAPLKKCMTQMLATLREPKSDEHIHRICPQLFIHGLSFAYQCCLLGLISSAKCLYEYLLEHSSSHFVNNRHAFEKAVAHQRYGLLLRKEKDWASSAKHLLLACKSAMKSGSYDRRLVVLLAINFTNLRPHLTTQPDEEDPLAESIELMLDRMRYQNFTSELVHVSRVEKYFESGLPRHFATFEPSAISHQMAHFTLPSITTEPSREDRNYTSTAGVSRRMTRSMRKSASRTMSLNPSVETSESTSSDESNPRGITWSDDENPGVDDGMF